MKFLYLLHESELQVRAYETLKKAGLNSYVPIHVHPGLWYTTQQ